MFFFGLPHFGEHNRRLRNMSTSVNLFKSSIIFPIHYVYGWIGRYLQTPLFSQASTYRSSDGEMCGREHGLSLVANDANISNTFKDLFVALRFSYLTLRIGVESIVEAYSLHYFSRQFGFCQYVPRSLKKEILTCSLKELGRLWQSCTLSSTSSKLLIPDNISLSPFVTKEYADWWAKCNKTSLEKTLRVVLKLNHLLNLGKGSKDNQVIPIVETEVVKPIATTSERRYNVLVNTSVTAFSNENDVISALSISNGQLSNPQPFEKVFDLDTVSVNSSFVEGVLSSFMLLNELAPYQASKGCAASYYGKSPLVEDVLEKSKKTLEAPFWPSSSAKERICQNIATTPTKRLSEVRQVTDALIKEMGTYMKDTPLLESHLKVFFEGVSNCARFKLESSRKVTREVYKEFLSLTKDAHFTIEAKEKEHAKEVESFKTEILQVLNQQGVWKKQLEELQHKDSSLHGAKGAF
ncbi:hypothetical protein Sango_1721600 [Sesamum angolense]|uniref:Uncharacterized protein n=1 Tax=Sesamum angolense TaxID=2727404 RepID=A0AAE2BS81_9LAMI|nr:hypothetical protein Sango_1721600 [Sesamum angolense]